MSVKIYSGYKLNGIKTVEDLNNFASVLVGLFNMMAKIDQERLIGFSSISIVDRISFGLANPRQYIQDNEWSFDESVYCIASEACHQRFKKIYDKGERDPFCDFYHSLNVTFVNGKCLAILDTDSNNITEAFELLEGVEPYFYFDNSDKPEEITKKDWNEREEDWEAAYKQSSNNSLAPISISNKAHICNYTLQVGLVYNSKEMNLPILSKSHRANDIAMDVLVSKRVEKDKNLGNDFHISDIWKHSKFFKNDPEGIKQLKKATIEIEKNLLDINDSFYKQKVEDIVVHELEL